MRIPTATPSLAAACCVAAPQPKLLKVDLGIGGPAKAACGADGPCTLTNHKGDRFAEGELRGGLPVDPWRIYDAKGNLREEGAYVAGKRQGE